MEGIVPLPPQRITTRPHTHSLSTSSVQTSPVVAASTRGTPPAPAAPATPAPSTGGTPPAPATPATPGVVVGYNNNCPPNLYVFKDKVCPYREQGCQYRTHIQNLLTRHVVRMHDPNFRQAYRRTTRAPRANPPNVAAEADEEDDFGRVPPLEITPQSARRRREPTTAGPQNAASFGSPDSSTLSVPSPFVRTPTGPAPALPNPISVPTATPATAASPPSNPTTPAIQSSSSHNPLVLSNQVTPPVSQVSPSVPQSLASLDDLSRPRFSSTPRLMPQSVDQQPAEEIVLGSRHHDTDPHNTTNEIKSFQLGENFSMLVCGPSGSGKTVFIAQLIVNKENICEVPPRRIISVYCNNESTINDLPGISLKINVNELNEQYSAEELERYIIRQATDNQPGADAPPSLVVFDDCQMKPILVKAISALFNGNARHNNMSLIYVGQKLFDGHEQNRISGNTKYLVLFKNARFKNECTILNRQINPGRPGIIADMLEALNPFEHLLITFEPRQQGDSKLKYLTNLFKTNHVVPVFVVSPAKSPLET